MDKYTEYLDNKVMDQAFDIGKLRGTLKSILKYNSSKLPEYVVEDIKRVLKETDGKPKEEVPSFHNGATRVEKYTGEVM